MPKNHDFQATSVVAALLCTLIGLAPSGWTQTPIPSHQTRLATVQYTEPSALDDLGEPTGRRRGGGRRGPCKVYEALTALTPMTTVNGKPKVLGLTATAQPTFWFHVPQALNAGTPLQFVLQDDKDNYVYQTKFTAPATPAGVLSVAVPPTARALEAGKSYRWTFFIYCNPQKASESVSVTGSVRRVALKPDVQQKLNAAKMPLDRAALYAANGIWYDALTTLGNQRRQRNEAAIATAWDNLLQQVKLDDLVTVPLVACCTPKD